MTDADINKWADEYDNSMKAECFMCGHRYYIDEMEVFGETLVCDDCLHLWTDNMSDRQIEDWIEDNRLLLERSTGIIWSVFYQSPETMTRVLQLWEEMKDEE